MHHLSHQIITPPRLASQGSGFVFVGQFRVNMQLDPSTDWTKFEYRQYIKGDCLIYMGSFIAEPRSRGTWRWSGQTPISGEQYFSIPGGLNNNDYMEDGEIVNGFTQKFGYRSNPPMHRQGITDHYLPSQANGRIYQSLDTFGIRGRNLQVGMRVIYNLHYEGRIIDTRLPRTGSQTILRRRWQINADDIVVPRT